MNFDKAFEILMKHEGGFVDHRDDPGRSTKYGVTEAVARAHGYQGSMRNLSLDTAKAIAKSSYWDKIRADELPEPLRYPMLDAAYNSGPGQAIKWLQRALGVKDDGVLGPQTIAAAKQADAHKLAARMAGHRLLMLANLQHFAQFGKGWTRRVASILTEA